LADANERRDWRIYIMDRGYIDFARLYAFTRQMAFFIVRGKRNLTLPALTIAKLYKCRWQVELFFKWIKQHLRIKAFYGTSQNAVKTQVWIAVSLYEILQIPSVALFEKTHIFEALTGENYPNGNTSRRNQLSLFDL
jgi:IS4 transposase